MKRQIFYEQKTDYVKEDYFVLHFDFPIFRVNGPDKNEKSAKCNSALGVIRFEVLNAYTANLYIGKAFSLGLVILTVCSIWMPNYIDEEIRIAPLGSKKE